MFWESIFVYRDLVGKPERKRRRRITRYGWDDNTEVDIQENCWEHG